MTIPEEILLSVRLELGLATRVELQDLVDRRLLEPGRPSETLLELATPGDMPPDDLAARLLALAGLTLDDRVAPMQVVVVAELLERGEVSLDHAVAYLCVRVAAFLEADLAARCGALDDMLYLARNHTWGSEAKVREELQALAEACRESLL